MKKLASIITLAALSLTSFTGCMTSTTNGVTTVNQAGLALDCLAIHAIVSQGSAQLVKNDPSVVPILKDIEAVLNGVINGASTTSASQIIALLGKNTTPQTALAITQIVTQVSQYEQKWLLGVSASVSGEITIAIAKAVNAGLAETVPL